jgi:hypothetical protein
MGMKTYFRWIENVFATTTIPIAILLVEKNMKQETHMRGFSGGRESSDVVFNNEKARAIAIRILE